MAKQSEDNLPKSLNNSLNTNFSSFIRKYTQKPPTVDYHSAILSKTCSRLRAENSSPQNLSNFLSPGSTPNLWISPRSKNQYPQLDGSSYFSQNLYLKEQKKNSTSSLATRSREVPSEDQSSDIYNGVLDHHTFYSSDFSLFDVKPSPRKPSVDLMPRSTQGQLFVVPLETVKEEKTPKVAKQTNSIQPQDAGKSKGLISSSAKSKQTGSRRSHFEGKRQGSSGSKERKSQSAKRKSSSPALKSINHYLKNFKLEKRSSSQTNPPSKPVITLKIPESIPNPTSKQVYQSPKETPKIVIGSTSPKKLRSTSPNTNRTNRLELRSPSCTKKSPLPETQASTEYLNKIFKGLDNRALLKFSPEHYKMLGKSSAHLDFLKISSEKTLLSQKGGFTTYRQNLALSPLQGEINSWSERSENKALNAELGSSIGNVEENPNGVSAVKEANNDINIENVSSTCSLGQGDDKSNSVGEHGTYEKKTKNEAISGTEDLREGEDVKIENKMLDSGVIRKDKETFEEFSDSAVMYMSEMIAIYEGKNSKIGEGSEHEEYLAMLLSHILNEISVLKKGIQGVAERERIAKKLFVLLEMALRSIICLTKRKGAVSGIIGHQKNLERLFARKGPIGVKEEKGEFEEICGLPSNQEDCDDKERQVREKLCQDIEKRREELENLEKALKQKKEKRMLEYVQAVKGDINKIFKSNKNTDKK